MGYAMKLSKIFLKVLIIFLWASVACADSHLIPGTDSFKQLMSMKWEFQSAFSSVSDPGMMFLLGTGLIGLAKLRGKRNV